MELTRSPRGVCWWLGGAGGHRVPVTHCRVVSLWLVSRASARKVAPSSLITLCCRLQGEEQAVSEHQGGRHLLHLSTPRHQTPVWGCQQCWVSRNPPDTALRGSQLHCPQQAALLLCSPASQGRFRAPLADGDLGPLLFPCPLQSGLLPSTAEPGCAQGLPMRVGAGKLRRAALQAARPMPLLLGVLQKLRLTSGRAGLGFFSVHQPVLLLPRGRWSCSAGWGEAGER